MDRLYLLILALVVVFGLRFAARRMLRGVGAKVLAKQPDAIHLHRLTVPLWKNAAAAEALASPLLARGFLDAGAFTVPEFPGLKLRLLAKPDECSGATIYEHPQAGVFADIYTRYQDGTGITFVTTRDRGLDQQPGRPTIHLPGMGTAELHEYFLSERPKGAMRCFTPETIVAYYEESYAQQAAWRKNKGISEREVTNVARTREPKTDR